MCSASYMVAIISSSSWVMEVMTDEYSASAHAEAVTSWDTTLLGGNAICSLQSRGTLQVNRESFSS